MIAELVPKPSGWLNVFLGKAIAAVRDLQPEPTHPTVLGRSLAEPQRKLSPQLTSSPCVNQKDSLALFLLVAWCRRCRFGRRRLRLLGRGGLAVGRCLFR